VEKRWECERIGRRKRKKKMRESRRGGGSTPVYFPSVYNETVDFYNPVQETLKRDCISSCDGEDKNPI
jgi:hypothetical protein